MTIWPRVCGTKEVCEILSYTGRFDPGLLKKAVEKDKDGRQHGEEKNQEMDQEERLRLMHCKVEAWARYKEARRLAKRLGDHPKGGRDAAQLAQRLTSHQRRLLERLKSGELLGEMNIAVTEWGHGRLEFPDGHFVDIGGSTGGWTRKLDDDWAAPSFECSILYRLVSA